MTLVGSLFARTSLRAWTIGVVATSAIALVWIGYRAVVEWQHAASMVASRRAESAVGLLMTALTRDIRGAQRTMLETADREGLTAGPALDLLQPLAAGLARYPYVQVFFRWSEARAEEGVTFYARSDRLPEWLPRPAAAGSYPVVAGHAPEVAKRLMARVREDEQRERRFSIFDLATHGHAYQVITVLSHSDPLREHAAGMLGFMVDLQWTRSNYFVTLVPEVATIEGSGPGLRFAILDDTGAAVVGGPPAPGNGPIARRALPLTFFDPLLIAIDAPHDLRVTTWTALAIADNDPTLSSAQRSAWRTLALAGVMAMVLMAGLILSLRAGAATAGLSEMRSDFVSAVTHELKAPIANLRAIHETLASARLDGEASREYAQMGVREATRLGRLVENLLAYARITDVTEAYSFEAVALDGIVKHSLREFSAHLTAARFEVRVDLPESLPAVRADPTALELLLNNLIDNAIRYADSIRQLTITAHAEGALVSLSVADRGRGIARDELEHVTKRFYRGRRREAAGSGLGLAIVDRIVKDHGGTLDITSAPGQGTTVTVALPIAS